MNLLILAAFVVVGFVSFATMSWDMRADPRTPT